VTTWKKLRFHESRQGTIEDALNRYNIKLNYLVNTWKKLRLHESRQGIIEDALNRLMKLNYLVKDIKQKSSN
jgi:hypothetical protein